MADMDKRYKILLVEDEKLDRMAFERFLAQNDKICTGETTGSVAEARERLAARTYDVIVTDYNLGDGTAFDVIPLAKGTPVIFATGGGNEEVAAQALKAGASDYLVKDADGGYLKILMLTIVRAMGRRRSEREARMLAEAVRSIADAVFVNDMEGNIVFVNAAFCRIYGYDPREALWERAEKMWAGPFPAASEVWRGEVEHKRRDGSVFPADYERSILHDEAGTPAFAVNVVRDVTEKKKAEMEKERLIIQLQDALAQVKKLSGLLPICAGCKQIRDEKNGGWKQIESYIADHSEANFTHGVCPECTKKLYPEYAGELAAMRQGPGAG